ncbi:drug/metabolite transporter (DMT)-like permease [Kineothrix alysoides]|uniref:Drug/metabolite transporter (DMT)-like permease n=1 Tax=Kineothrix alysoides TaxID=1469948 RepID=A0A4R1QPJ7_9FIRM|nr:DMT family transporter [Kineothrix alysoides]TCL55267.1 drug/metabolite transporter (DMT)-like permease [Kineothrix alysoides]
MKKTAIFMAILAAVCYGISAPVSKILLEELSPVFMASLLYLGAGAGMLIVNLLRGKRSEQKEAKITRNELPYVAGMIALDIAAPIFLMLGLSLTTSANASLMNNFEIVATAVIALAIFKEAIGKRMWIAIFLITASSMILSVEDFSTFSFSIGSLFILLACVCWGFENNCTRMLSLKDPFEIVIIKGFGSGFGSLLIAAVSSEIIFHGVYIAFSFLLGFVSYGLSIFFYIRAQRELGAARTSAYYAVSPFIGVFLSFMIFGQDLTLSFSVAAVIMAAGAYLAAFEKHEHTHVHHESDHEHRHNHNDGHHIHTHDYPVEGEHSHPHIHEEMVHTHVHTPDLHHTHEH